MAFPEGVTTATISLGTMFDFRGNAVEDVTAKVEVFLGGNATKLNYRGTGQTVVPSVFTVKAVEGMISFQLPHVDQPGFFAGDGSEAKYWAYIISIQATPKGSKAVNWVKRLQPVVGQTSIDLDNVVDGELTSFVSTPKATVTSVNGMTGDVWVDGSGESVDLSLYPTRSEVTQEIANSSATYDDTALADRVTALEQAPAPTYDDTALADRVTALEQEPDTTYDDTALADRVAALESAPSPQYQLVENPAGSGLYEIQEV